MLKITRAANGACAGLHHTALLLSNHERRPRVSPGGGTDQRYGARHLKRAIERYVVYPIAKLLATAQVHQGDALVIDRHHGEEGLVFLRDTEEQPSGSKIDFPIQDSGQLMTAEARV